jgi:hypothetical protein
MRDRGSNRSRRSTFLANWRRRSKQLSRRLTVQSFRSMISSAARTEISESGTLAGRSIAARSIGKPAVPVRAGSVTPAERNKAQPQERRRPPLLIRPIGLSSRSTLIARGGRFFQLLRRSVQETSGRAERPAPNPTPAPNVKVRARRRGRPGDLRSGRGQGPETRAQRQFGPRVGSETRAQRQPSEFN